MLELAYKDFTDTELPVAMGRSAKWLTEDKPFVQDVLVLWDSFDSLSITDDTLGEWTVRIYYYLS